MWLHKYTLSAPQQLYIYNTSLIKAQRNMISAVTVAKVIVNNPPRIRLCLPPATITVHASSIADASNEAVTAFV